MQNNISNLNIEIDMSISLGTIIALIALIVSISGLAYVVHLERKRDFENRKAIINALFNEINVNIRTSNSSFVKEASDIFIKKICSTLLFLYTESYRGEIEYFGVYCPDNDKCYLVPVDDVAKTVGILRVEPTLNNQSKGVRWAKDYEIK